MKIDGILHEITNERERQDQLWGKEFDDRNTTYNWAAYICQYATRHLIGSPADVSEKAFRDDMVKVAALAVAAIEAMDRFR